jgi:hypothetical protein
LTRDCGHLQSTVCGRRWDERGARPSRFLPGSLGKAAACNPKRSPNPAAIEMTLKNRSSGTARLRPKLRRFESGPSTRRNGRSPGSRRQPRPRSDILAMSRERRPHFQSPEMDPHLRCRKSRAAARNWFWRLNFRGSVSFKEA